MMQAGITVSQARSQPGAGGVMAPLTEPGSFTPVLSLSSRGMCSVEYTTILSLASRRGPRPDMDMSTFLLT